MRKKLVVCVGAALIDESYHCQEQPIRGTSNPAIFYRSSGGVACNIANHLALLGNNVELISHFGNDPEGNWLMEQCQSNGIGIAQSVVNDIDTGRFVAILSPNGELFAGAVSSHFETLITPEFLQDKIPFLKNASLLLIDCNLSTESLNWLLGFAREEHIPCIIEPVSVPKAARLQKSDLQNALLITPNKDEMVAMTGQSSGKQTEVLVQQILDRGVKFLWVRNGKNGSCIYGKDYSFELSAPDVQVKDTTGAGDAALAGWVHAWLMDKNPDDCVRYGHAMAALVLQEKGAIKIDLSAALLEKNLE